jgi:predicted RNA-binding Zn-ribbon protein involved in translation (DUF1610 family)
MKLEQCHPSWRNSADFKCPACGAFLLDTSTSHEDDLEEPCPKCSAPLRVHRSVQITYSATVGKSVEDGK